MNNQPAEKKNHSNPIALSVHSIFKTIQGEGPYAGSPAVFIRLAGCNLQCPGCDTDYTEGRETFLVRNIIERVFELSGTRKGLVIITGGEPFRQNLEVLINLLLLATYQVQIETNGTLAPGFHLPSAVDVVCSPKTGSVNCKLQPYITSYKYVLHSEYVEEDGLPSKALGHAAAPYVARPHDGFKGDIYLQPEDTGDQLQNKLNEDAVVQSCLKHGYRVQLQLHKLLNLE